MNYKINYLRFSLWFAGLSIALPLLAYGIEVAFGVDIANAGMSIIPIMGGAAYEGIGFAQQTKRGPTGAEAWRIALRLAIVGFALSLLMAVPIFFWMQDTLMQVFESIGILGLALITVFALVMQIVMARIFFGMYARNQVMAMERAGK